MQSPTETSVSEMEFESLIAFQRSEMQIEFSCFSKGRSLKMAPLALVELGGIYARMWSVQTGESQ
jgi:hypothetical protein